MEQPLLEHFQPRRHVRPGRERDSSSECELEKQSLRLQYICSDVSLERRQRVGASHGEATLPPRIVCGRMTLDLHLPVLPPDPDYESKTGLIVRKSIRLRRSRIPDAIGDSCHTMPVSEREVVETC